jgi:hypothetical protein
MPDASSAEKITYLILHISKQATCKIKWYTRISNKYFWFIFSISTWFALEAQNVEVVDLKCQQTPRGSYFAFENLDNKDGRNVENTAQFYSMQFRLLATNRQTYDQSDIIHTLLISASVVSLTTFPTVSSPLTTYLNLI